MKQFPHYDTSAYAFNGVAQTPDYNDPYRYAGVEDNYEAGRLVNDFNGESVDEFCEELEDTRQDHYDSIFGLGNKKKQAERKLRRAKPKLSKGKTKAAARLTNKATKLLGKIESGQQNTQDALQKLQNVNLNQTQLDRATEAAFNPDTTSVTNPLSVQTMSPTASQQGASAMPTPTPAQMGGGGGMDMGGGGGMDMSEYAQGYNTSSLTGVESQASDFADDEPTGALAETKVLDAVTVKGKRKKKGDIIVIIILAVVVIGAIVYFSKGKKGMKF